MNKYSHKQQYGAKENIYSMIQLLWSSKIGKTILFKDTYMGGETKGSKDMTLIKVKIMTNFKGIRE